MRIHFKALVYSYLLVFLLIGFSCRKKVSDLPARTKIDIISLSFGNTKTESIITIQNTGQQTLNFSLSEDISWLALDTTNGQIPGNSYRQITATVNREGLPKNRYEGVIGVSTSDKTTSITAYLTVDMFLVTVLNPVFTPIEIEVDSSNFKTADNNYKRVIGAADSTQFSYFDRPDLFIYYAQTSGIYSDSTQIGLKMEWNEIAVVGGTEVPRIFLDVPKEYFFLSIINTFQNLYPLYVNAGTSFEKVENIVIYQSSEPLPIGYYQAFENTVIRAFVYGSSRSATWSQGDQFSFPFTKNQAITLENYMSDTTKNAIPKKHYQIQPSQVCFDRNYGDVFEIVGKSRQNFSK